MKQLFGYQSYWFVGATLTLGLLGWLGVEQATAQVRPGAPPGVGSQAPGVTVYTVPSQQAQEYVDYVNAQAMPLPKGPRGSAAQVRDDLINSLASQITLAESGGSMPGSNGTGALDPVSLGVPRPTTHDAEGVTPQEFGIANQPFSTARADLSLDLSQFPTNIYYPYSASGKVFFNIGLNTFVCSASLISRGLSSSRRTAWRLLASSSFILAGNSFLDTGTAWPPSGCGPCARRSS